LGKRKKTKLPIITRLKSQKNKNRVNLYLDNKFAFGLSLDEVVSKGLAVRQELSDKQVDKLFFSSNLELLYQKTINFLSYRFRSEKEIKDYLNKNLSKQDKVVDQLKEKLTEKIITKLKKQKLIDDQKFALWWIEQRLSFKPKGKWALKAELIKKGIDKEIIEQSLSTISSQQSSVAAQKIIDKKIRLYQKLPKQKLKQKLFAHLARRGFDYELIKKVIDESLERR